MPLLIVFLSSCDLGTSSETASRAACERARERATEVQLTEAQASGVALSAEVVAGHRAAAIAVLGEAYLADCADRGEAWAACVGRARTSADVDACGEVVP